MTRPSLMRPVAKGAPGGRKEKLERLFDGAGRMR
jgi:hypothetical protein